MKKLKLVLIVILVAILVSIGSYFVLLSWPNLKNNVENIDIKDRLGRPDDQLFGWQYPIIMFPEVGSITEKLAYSTIRDPGGIPRGLPVRLKIPVINVDSAIEDALITSDGRMDVPYGSVNVAWFALGPKPGFKGSAVIGGHFGINAGVKFVFYDLDKLKIGDRVYIIDDNGKTLTFQVRRIELFERNADATTVFTSDDGLAHLNLITCEGIWNKIDDTYPLRRVVFTDAISVGEVTEVSETFSRSLSIGARGNDVVELQTILVEKGFLIIPRGVSKGYFGTLTRSAVSRYQASVNLSSTGIFDSVTKIKLVDTVTEGLTETSETFFRSLSIGARGNDVVELQTILVEKGFLVIPRGVSKGYFGTLTRSAVSRYQASVNLSSTGIFDYSTRAKLIPTATVVIEPSLPSTAISLDTPPFSKVIVEHIKSLYATPKDGIITSILFIIIIFISVAISNKKFKSLN